VDLADHETTDADPASLSALEMDAWRALLAAELAASDADELAHILESPEILRHLRTDVYARTGLEPAGARRPTVVAGVVLLYPWLGRLIDTARDRLGQRPEVVLATLHALVPNRAVPIGDPLLRVLAGVEPGTDVDLEMAADPALAPPRKEAMAVLERFIATLPGRWSMDVIIDELLVRWGALERDPVDGWLLVPEPRPLDVLLQRLPYPLGSFRLPGTDLIHVRWRHA
jgi:hypothetical protein